MRFLNTYGVFFGNPITSASAKSFSYAFVSAKKDEILCEILCQKQYSQVSNIYKEYFL